MSTLCRLSTRKEQDDMNDPEVLMKPATTLDDVLREVRELRAEVRKYQSRVSAFEAIESAREGLRRIGAIE
jgi:hypothetical protein